MYLHSTMLPIYRSFFTCFLHVFLIFNYWNFGIGMFVLKSSNSVKLRKNKHWEVGNNSKINKREIFIWHSRVALLCGLQPCYQSLLDKLPWREVSIVVIGYLEVVLLLWLQERRGPHQFSLAEQIVWPLQH